MKFNKQCVKNFIKAVGFISIVFVVFLFCTYFFRNTNRNTRQIILEYYEEDKNSLDVVCVGASNTYRYWDPLGAWKEYGFSSRNYSTSAMAAGTYMTAIKEAVKTQSPKVIVMEARAFTRSFEPGQIEIGARNVLDSLDYDLSRLRAVHYYCDVMDISWEDSVSLYVDLIQYHDNYDAIKEPMNWKLADNRIGQVDDYEKIYKGYAISSKKVAFDNPTASLTDECMELDPIAERFYRDVIEYCQKKDIPLLIVASPIVITEEESARTNTLMQIAESYNVEFLDTNRFYEEMGIDFEQDFMDVHHVNVLGATKYTKFLAEYLMENYDLPTHYDDEEYDSWDELYEEYYTVVEKARNKALANE